MTPSISAAQISAAAAENVTEIGSVVEAVSADELARAAEIIAAAPRAYFSGIGRSGLMARAIAMRLMHTGLQAFAVGEIATPGIRQDDVLVVFSSSGTGAIAAEVDKARRLGAHVVALTTAADNPIAATADSVVVIPVRHGVSSVQHAGSLFEQSCLVVGDAICRVIQGALGVLTSELDQRHANLP